jgi:hypothetical protein
VTNASTLSSQRARTPAACHMGTLFLKLSSATRAELVCEMQLSCSLLRWPHHADITATRIQFSVLVRCSLAHTLDGAAVHGIRGVHGGDCRLVRVALRSGASSANIREPVTCAVRSYSVVKNAECALLSASGQLFVGRIRPLRSITATRESGRFN